MADRSALPAGIPTTAHGSVPGAAVGGGLMPLHAAFGQDEANYGTVCYRVDFDGFVWVPLEAVTALVERGGFALPKTPGAATCSSGPIKLHHDNAPGCSFAGRQYPADVNGDVVVPAEAAAELAAHGFVPAHLNTIPAPRRTKLPAGKRAEKG